MAPRTRLDRLVWIRERREESALVQLAGAEQRLVSARAELGRKTAVAGHDARSSGDAALWDLDDAARRRALQAVKVAEKQVAAAANACDAARATWTSAHQGTEVATRICERKRAELRADLERRDRRDADEVAVLRFARQAS
jgi:flagellar export protein FliJ